MPNPLYVTVNTNANASPGFTLERPDHRHMLAVPSLGRGNLVSLEFSATSGGPVWSPLQRSDGTGAVFACHSGEGPCFAPWPKAPTAWARLSLSSGPTIVSTFTLFTSISRW